MNPIDENPRPQGELALQTVAMPADTNANGDIFGGWLLSQMDIAGGVAAAEVARGRVATVAVQGMSFLIEVWINSQHDGDPIKVTEGEFIYVAIDNAKRTRTIGQ
jgi:acyl-CoA thioesterase YciA